MGYRIVYGTPHPRERGHGLRQRPVWIALAAVLVVGAVAVLATQPECRQWLLPGDPAVTGAALDNLVESIQQGIPAGECIAAFCQEIVANAAITP